MQNLHRRRSLGQRLTDTAMGNGDVVAYGGHDWRVKYVHPLGRFWTGVRACGSAGQTEQTFWSFPMLDREARKADNR